MTTIRTENRNEPIPRSPTYSWVWLVATAVAVSAISNAIS